MLIIKILLSIITIYALYIGITSLIYEIKRSIRIGDNLPEIYGNILLDIFVFIFYTFWFCVPLFGTLTAVYRHLKLIEATDKKTETKKKKDKYEKVLDNYDYIYHSSLYSSNLYEKIRSLRDSYRFITSQILYRDIAYNRFDYFLTLIVKTLESGTNIRQSQVLLDEFHEMADNLKTLFDKLIKDIAVEKDKIQKESEKQLLEITKKFKDDTKQIQKSFDNINKALEEKSKVVSENCKVS